MPRLFFIILLALVSLLSPAAATPPQEPPPPSSIKRAKYWINRTSRKTHNYRCRYYYNCQGYPSDTPSGNNCKLCGGAK